MGGLSSVAAVIVLLLSTALVVGTPGHPASGSGVGVRLDLSPPVPAETRAASPSIVGAGPGPPLGLSWLNATVLSGESRSLAPPSPPPNAGVLDTPAPPAPNTTPVILTFATNFTKCCLYANFPAPAGNWSLIELNYTGLVHPDVFDSSYRAYIDGAEILFGTTPEYGTWTVLKDLTQYSSLFTGTVNLTFLLSAAIPSGSPGYFSTAVQLLFYPTPAGSTPPQEPNLVVPLFTGAYVKSPTVPLWANLTVPSNTVNATLELYTYGFVSDEFWYASAPTRPDVFRDVIISVDGLAVGSFLPFPSINTGGLLFNMWRPMPAAFTLSERPYHVDLSGALGLFEGAHNWTARVTGLSSPSVWAVGGSLLLFTNRSVLSARETSYSFTPATPTISSRGPYQNESGSLSYNYSSQLLLSKGIVNVSDSAVQSAVDHQLSPGRWANVSLLEQNTITATRGSTTTVTRLTFPFTANIGNVFVQTKTTGGGYPIFGNFTLSLVDLHQEWRETSSVLANGTTLLSRSTVDNLIAGPSGITSGYEEIPTAGGAPLVITTYTITANTIEEYSQGQQVGTISWSWSHLLIGAAYQPPPPYIAETIIVDAVNVTLGAQLHLLPASTDVGLPFALSAEVHGGQGAFSYTWFGLPPGCATANTGSLACTPSAAGSFSVSVLAVDGRGDSAFAAPVALVVHPDPTVVVVSNVTALDVGQSIRFNASISGGTGPYRCQWSVNGSLFGPLQSCGASIVLNATVPGPLDVNVTAVDAVTATGRSLALTVRVVPAPVLTNLVVVPAVGLTVGRVVTLSAWVVGGTPPLHFAWSLNGSPRPGVDFPNLTFSPQGTGTFNFGVVVTDGVGEQSSGSFPPVTVAAAAPGSSGGSGPAPTFSDAALELALLEGVGIVVLAAVVVYLWKRGPPPRRPSTARRSR